MRLNIASGTAVRFEPGQQRTVELVDYAGDRRVSALRLPRGLVPGRDLMMATIGAPRLCRDVRPDHRRPRAPGRHRTDRSRSRRLHAHAGGYGEEVKFGGGKTIRDGMGQCQRVNGPDPHEAVRLRDHQRADPRPLGHRQGRHRPARAAASSAIGKAGNPDVQPGVRHRHRPGHRDHRRRRPDRHRRRHRHATSTSSARSRSRRR